MTRPAATSSGFPTWVVTAVLVASVVAIYAPVRDFGFAVLDDYGWLVENDIVNAGFSWPALVRAFTESALGNWVPVTWLSHMLDVELFGLAPGPHHVVNVLLHLATSLTLFAALRRMSGDPAPSAFVALVFAVHPVHVESVAWLAERRDVLSGLFWMLSLLAWADYTRSRKRRFFALAILAFAAGLLSKPMLVTLPVVLLLLDLWPLGRIELGMPKLIAEKLAFVVIALLVAGATLATQGAAGAVVSLEVLPLTTRVANAFTSSVAYIVSCAWPTPLAVFYPHADSVLPWPVAAAAAFVVALTCGALSQARRRPWLCVGWFWFVVTLLPVIGLIQVGSQARADRYLYLPLVGVAIAAAWTGAEFARHGERTRRFVLALAAAWLVFCGMLARGQVETWRDSVTLFEHARAVSGDHPIILVNLAEAHERAGNADRAIEFYLVGLRDYAHAPRARTRLGALLARRGRLPEAAEQLEEALSRHPEEPHTRLEIGRLLLRDGQPDAAAAYLEEEDSRFPDAAIARFHLAEARAASGARDESIDLFVAAWSAAPELADAPILDRPLVAEALAGALAQLGRAERALHWTRRGILLARLGGDIEVAERLHALLAEREATAAAMRGE
jgi:tetratricopeptide (TPR) repeat protein